MQTHLLKVFGAEPDGGNPAIVIEHDHGDADARLAFALRHGSTCVFIDTGRDGAAEDEAAGDIVLDYFYPHTRSPLCLHATLAAARVLFEREAGRREITVRTAMRGQALTLLNTDDGLFVRLARQEAPAPALEPDLAAALLDRPGLRSPSAPAIASVGSPKLLLEVADSLTLQSLRPNLELIADWGRQHGVSGCFVYCLMPDGQYQGRNFNHLDPAMEDSATGVAAGALSLHLGRALTLSQGRMQASPCLIHTRLDGEHVLIGGATAWCGRTSQVQM